MAGSCWFPTAPRRQARGQGDGVGKAGPLQRFPPAVSLKSQTDQGGLAGLKDLGPYQLVRSIGAGGMGEVFRARDTRLNRDVAIKILPKTFISDPDRLRRFEQESKTLAALNHPNILTIHDAGLHEGTPYLVSELLEGDTLREILARARKAPLPPRKAMEYALQMVQALAAAHSKGIIHRDLKPENIFITKDGRVKILDFGLAKLQVPDLNSELPNLRSKADEAAPTLLDATQPGAAIGTPAYMSPEQVRGEKADPRSDIFSFGSVLYEMLTGARAFRRDTPVETMNAVLSEEPPDPASAGAALPSGLASIVRRCLEKQTDHRFQAAKDVGFAIELVLKELIGQKPGRPAALSAQIMTGRRLLAGVGILLLGLGSGLLLDHLGTPHISLATPSIRYLTYSGRDYSPAISMDGKRVCYSSDRNGLRQIWIKDIASGSESRLTDGPDDFPRFSRDGNSVLFTHALDDKRSLFRAVGGECFKIVDDALSGDWSPDGRQIAFARWADDGSSSLFLVAVDGSGEALLHRFPQARCSAPRWSPDGRTIAAPINDYGRPQSIALVDVATRKVRMLPAPHPYHQLSSAAWDSTSRYLFYMQAESSSALTSTGVLYRQGVDSSAFQRLLWSPTHCTTLDLLPSGNVVLDARSSRDNLREFPTGSAKGIAHLLTRGNSTDRQPVYSPDGEQILFSSNRSGNLEIWSFSRTTEKFRRLTDNPADDWDPVLSPDGQHLIWGSNRAGNLEIWIANADGSAPTQVTHDGFSAENPTMTRDERWIVYSSAAPSKAGIWKIHPDGSDASQLVGSLTAGNPEVSPDGRYAAYVDNRRSSLVIIRVIEIESGAPVGPEIHIDVRKETVAIIGRVRWMPDGKSLVFLGQDERGVNGLFVQDFVPGVDTAKSRRQLGPFDPENSAESFGISPDGKFITVAFWEQLFSIMRTEDLAVP
jgi:eukaryotic-like serine/threonine-protein kinase